MKKTDAQTVHLEPMGALKEMLPELQDLKRQQPAHYTKSIASSLFTESWERLLYGKNPKDIALRITLKALLAIVLPGCDGHFFKTAGIDQKSAETILKSAFYEQIGDRIDSRLYQNLWKEIPELVAEFFVETNFRKKLDPYDSKYWFVEALCNQPRAGATKPGMSRLLLVPPEMHSEHCLITAVYAVLLSPGFNAEIGLPFLTGLTHHLHNAVLPDCGFAGEIALGEYLHPIIENSRAEALKHVDKKSSEHIMNAILNHENLENAEGRSSSAADVLDRVLDIKWRVRAASVIEKDVLDDLELVHDGPIKSFQMEVLKSADL
ncbi:hypothetical protein [Flavimarina sp. Hel_I_48]|uniref:hypothetical protein n=1 Tax=Flavimarina sp. Hel_I_48 TaxID=1392488 RepID=UPI00068CE2AE|nr:hypothetical protein [Flavimarina sp. Hel_I_48]